MICPKCGAEYREGFTQCSDCEVGLVDALPEAEEPRPETGAGIVGEARASGSAHAPEPSEPFRDPSGQFELVTVLATNDRNLIVVAESILRSAGVPFVSEVDSIVDLFGAGRLGYCNPVTGPPRLRVAPHDAADARALLAELQTSL